MRETDSGQVPRGKVEKHSEERVKQYVKPSGGKRLGTERGPSGLQLRPSGAVARWPVGRAATGCGETGGDVRQQRARSGGLAARRLAGPFPLPRIDRRRANPLTTLLHGGRAERISPTRGERGRCSQRPAASPGPGPREASSWRRGSAAERVRPGDPS